jgi:hypothetical protein
VGNHAAHISLVIFHVLVDQEGGIDAGGIYDGSHEGIEVLMAVYYLEEFPNSSVWLTCHAN